MLTRFLSEWGSKNESVNYVSDREHQARRGTDPEFASSSAPSTDFLRSAAAKLNLQRYSVYPPLVKPYLNTHGSDQSSLIWRDRITGSTNTFRDFH